MKKLATPKRRRRSRLPSCNLVRPTPFSTRLNQRTSFAECCRSPRRSPKTAWFWISSQVRVRPRTLLDNIEHLKAGRSEDDILYELLLKLGLDLCVPIETRTIVGKLVRSIGAGTLVACLNEKIGGRDVEPLAHGIVAWHAELAPAGETAVVFRDSAFADDIAKTNCTAILQQHGLGNVRSL